MASINMSRKSSHSFGNRSVRTIGGGSRNNLFASSSRKSVVIDSTRQDKSQTKPPVQVRSGIFALFIFSDAHG